MRMYEVVCRPYNEAVEGLGLMAKDSRHSSKIIRADVKNAGII